MLTTKQNFMRNECMTLTINGSLATRRWKVYRDGASEKEKIRDELKNQLLRLETQYCGSVTDDQHMQNIVDLADHMTNKFSTKLAGGRFRIGIAQKALNLYLKYMWCMDILKEPPPHCPFDARIISKLPSCKCTQEWTKTDSISDYQCWVEDARNEAKKVGLSLPDWELKEWLSATLLGSTASTSKIAGGES
jgi:hypothetical protein